MIRSTGRASTYGCGSIGWRDSHRPSGTDSFLKRIPGNKLPGYDHSVPTGQRRSSLACSYIATIQEYVWIISLACLTILSHGPPSTYRIAFSGRCAAGAGARGGRSDEREHLRIGKEEVATQVGSDRGGSAASILTTYCVRGGSYYPDLDLCDEPHGTGRS
jgi:hypothetical protein